MLTPFATLRSSAGQTTVGINLLPHPYKGHNRALNGGGGSRVYVEIASQEQTTKNHAHDFAIQDTYFATAAAGSSRNERRSSNSSGSRQQQKRTT